MISASTLPFSRWISLGWQVGKAGVNDGRIELALIDAPALAAEGLDREHVGAVKMAVKGLVVLLRDIGVAGALRAQTRRESIHQTADGGLQSLNFVQDQARAHIEEMLHPGWCRNHLHLAGAVDPLLAELRSGYRLGIQDHQQVLMIPYLHIEQPVESGPIQHVADLLRPAFYMQPLPAAHFIEELRHRERGEEAIKINDRHGVRRSPSRPESPLLRRRRLCR